jgi:hypothetical protein
MCQLICCDCWWCNWCGVICGGWHNAYCCCSFWLCMPDEMQQIDPECCKVGQMTGCGYNHCCWGNILCIPDSIRTYSGVVTMGADVVGVNNGMTAMPFNQGYN